MRKLRKWDSYALFFGAVFRIISNTLCSKNNRSRTLFGWVFCFVLLFSSLVSAQRLHKDSGVGGQLEVSPLAVGDTIPQELWAMRFKVVNHPQGEETITLEDYRNDKLIILDFWATWCGGCLASFPYMHEIGATLAKQVSILQVTTQNDSIVYNFLDRGTLSDVTGGNSKLYSIVEGMDLWKLFRSASIPHVVVIDPRGVVRAKTVPTALTTTNLLEIYNDASSRAIAPIVEKVTKPLLAATYGQGANKVFYSGVYPFERTLPFIEHTSVDSINGTKHFYCVNAPILQQFSAALKFTPDYVNGLWRIPSRRILEVSNPDRFDDREMEGNLANWYTYESVSSFQTSDESVRKKMYEDLQFYLGFTASYETRRVRCLVLHVADSSKIQWSNTTGSDSQFVLGGKTDGDGTVDGRFKQRVADRKMPNNSYAYNFQIERFAYILNQRMRLSIPYVVDETALKSPVNLVLPDDLSDIPELKKCLLEQGISLDYENRELNMLVIKESNKMLPSKELVLRSYGYVYEDRKENTK